MSKYFAVIMFAITGCAAKSDVIIAPDGGEANLITCSDLNPHKCIIKAGQECPNGYQLLAKGGGQQPAVITTNNFVVPDNYILVRCN